MRLDDLLTTPHHPGTLIDQREYGLTPENPVHKSHIKAYLACPRAFYLRMVRGLPAAKGDRVPGHFVTGRFYHAVLQACVDDPTGSASNCYAAALGRLTPAEQNSLSTGALAHAMLLARHYAGKLAGQAEVHWLSQLGTIYWFAGSFDYVPADAAEPIIDWKTNSMPCQHEAQHGPEATIYRLAWRTMHQEQHETPRAIEFVRLSQHWPDRRSCRRCKSVYAGGEILPASIAEIVSAVNAIRGILSSSRRFSSDCHYCPVASYCMTPEYLLPARNCNA